MARVTFGSDTPPVRRAGAGRAGVVGPLAAVLERSRQHARPLGVLCLGVGSAAGLLASTGATMLERGLRGALGGPMDADTLAQLQTAAAGLPDDTRAQVTGLLAHLQAGGAAPSTGLVPGSVMGGSLLILLALGLATLLSLVVLSAGTRVGLDAATGPGAPASDARELWQQGMRDAGGMTRLGLAKYGPAVGALGAALLFLPMPLGLAVGLGVALGLGLVRAGRGLSAEAVWIRAQAEQRAGAGAGGRHPAEVQAALRESSQQMAGHLRSGLLGYGAVALTLGVATVGLGLVPVVGDLLALDVSFVMIALLGVLGGVWETVAGDGAHGRTPD